MASNEVIAWEGLTYTQTHACATCGGGAELFKDPDQTSSCWELVLWEEVGLLMGLSGASLTLITSG